MYVANSEPATWHWGEGRAALSRRVPISGQTKEGIIVRTNAELDGIWGGSMPYPGKPYCSGVEVAKKRYKTEAIRRHRRAKGQRVADSQVVLMT